MSNEWYVCSLCGVTYIPEMTPASTNSTNSNNSRQRLEYCSDKCYEVADLERQSILSCFKCVLGE